MLDPHPRRQLCLIVEQHGQSIINEPKRCRGLLNDLAPQYRLENNLLMMALEQDIAEQLLTPSSFMNIELQLERLAQSLRDAIGVEEELAYWAVESWALALGVIQYPIPRAVQSKAEALPVLSPFSVKNTKKTRQLSFVVFFTAWMVAGLFIATIFDLSSKSTHERGASKPSAVNQAVLDVSKSSSDESVSVQQDGWTANYTGDAYYEVKNYLKAAEWYRKSAEQSYAKGQCNLGFMYENGYGVAKNYQQAADWYRKAAEQGNADGQNNLALMYENGYGVAKDRQKAVEWYRKAAEQGHYGAQQALKSLLETP
ncbi:MAG: tetratricopeptide repeat protein [Methylococcales bacterium]